MTSPDPCVRFMAKRVLQRELTLQCPKFKPSGVVRDVMVIDPNFSRKSVSKEAKLVVEEETNETRRLHLLALEKEGQIFRVTSPDAANVWCSVLRQLPDDQRKFVLNSTLDTLPHNANLCLWGKRAADSCPLCYERQSLIHALNTCPRALEARRYNLRHDSVLEKIATTISTYLQPSERMCSDLSEYNFPQHITPTTLRPDAVIWDDVKKKLLLVS